MRNVLLWCLGACLMVALPYWVVMADEAPTAQTERQLQQQIAEVYKKIDFTNVDRLPFYVFQKAYIGYQNLKYAGKLDDDKRVITICDFNLPSTENRMWVIDLATKKVLFNTYVAHGQGTGEECAVAFSNKMNSHQSSIGFYVTGDTYTGEHGTSLHLYGMDKGFNDAAYQRDIVVHGADYVSDRFIKENERLGRSWGCPAVAPELAIPIINTIKEGSCLFIYYPDQQYLQTAYWLNERKRLAEGDLFAQLLPEEQPKPRMRTIQYMTNGKVDSVVRVPLTQ